MSEYEKSEMEPGNYRVKWELQVLVCRGYYSGETTPIDNY